jgi:hypothetical protein
MEGRRFRYRNQGTLGTWLPEKGWAGVNSRRRLLSQAPLLALVDTERSAKGQVLSGPRPWESNYDLHDVAHLYCERVWSLGFPCFVNELQPARRVRDPWPDAVHHRALKLGSRLTDSRQDTTWKPEFTVGTHLWFHPHCPGLQDSDADTFPIKQAPNSVSRTPTSWAAQPNTILMQR